MFYSILAFLLTVILGFTIAALIAVLAKLILFVFSFFIIGQKKMVHHFTKIAQPIDFIASIIHGWMAVWLGRMMFREFDVTIDLFLPVSLLLLFLWSDFNRVRRRKQLIDVKSEFKVEISDELNITDNMSGEQISVQKQMKQMVYSSSVITMIGKATGIILAAMNLIGLHTGFGG